VGRSPASPGPVLRAEPGPDGINAAGRLVARRTWALHQQTDIPDRHHRSGEDRVLIHVFQVEIAEREVGAQQLFESLQLGVVERPITPT
jgi:hypothetical protein